MHKLLERQLRKYIAGSENPLLPEKFIQAINDAYMQADNERALLERSLSLMSKELSTRNAELKQKIEQQGRMHKELERSLATLQATFDSTGEAIFAVDMDTLQVTCNQLGKLMLNLNPEKEYYSLIYCLRKFKQQLKDNLTFAQLKQAFSHLEEHGLYYTVELKNGTLFEVYTSAKLYQGQTIGRVWCFRDVTEHRKSQAVIQHQAYHDALTNLPNRLLLNDRLEHAIAMARRENSLIAVLFIDLDHFKKVNDTLGHQVGDEILVQVGKRIRQSVREQDTLARIGGDEFVVIVENFQDTAFLARFATRIIDFVKQPFHYMNNEYFIGCSIGISTFPHDGNNVQELLRKSDMSMYHAKDKGRSNFQYFDEAFEQRAMHQLGVENNLRHAVAKGAFELHYQPKIDLLTGKIASAEALIRWTHNGQAISPAEFIPIAEQSGLIREISQWVFNEVCRHITQWQAREVEPIPIAVNLSSMNFDDSEFLQFIAKTMYQYKIPGQWLDFEVTETELLEGTHNATAFIEYIKGLGISLTIDDFGTGYSSLSYLHKLPFDALKIDKSFILELLEDEQNQAIARTVIGLAKSLGLSVVAEGVETAEAHAWLMAQNCDFAQGFFYHRPMPESDFFRLIECDRRLYG